MKRVHSCALAAGVSVLALIPVVGGAATVGTVPQTGAGPDVTLDLELSTIPLGPVFGENGTVAPTTSSAVVNSTAKGQIKQTGTANGATGFADLAITNVADVTVHAIATDLGGPSALADIAGALFQSAFAVGSSGSAKADLSNDGSLVILSDASADAAGAATAIGNISSAAILQNAAGANAVDAGFRNGADGTIAINVKAHATSASGAAAGLANILPFGVFQGATVSSGVAGAAANAGLVNEGDMLIGAEGVASGDQAYALGSGLVDQSQKITVAASAMAEKKTVGQRS